MFVKWLRENRFAAGILFVLRLYLGWAWLKAGWGKVTGNFDATGYLKGTVAKAAGDNPAVQGWWANFIDAVALPNAGLFSFLVAYGELLVGIALILGVFTTFSALMGIIMNFAFLFSGTVSTNPNMVLVSIFILVAGAHAGRLGLDYYVLPYVKKTAANLFSPGKG